MRFNLCIAAVVAFSACATGPWTHPAKTEADFHREYHECEVQAAQVAANWGSSGNIFIMADEIGTCLRTKGWTRQSPQQAASSQAIAENFYVIDAHGRSQSGTVAARGGGQSPLRVGASDVSDDHVSISATLSTIPMRLAVTIANSGSTPLRVLWNDASIVDKDGKSHRVFREGTDFARRDDVQQPSIIAPAARVETSMMESDSLRQIGARWNAQVWLPKEMFDSDNKQLRPMPGGVSASDLNGAVQQRLIGKSLRLFLPIEVGTDLRDYTIEIPISEIIVRKVTQAEFERMAFPWS